MTYKAKLWAIEEARQELAYLSTVNPEAPGAAFNHDRDCFARYANMQANHMLASGYPLIAHDATQYRDIANPEFRSEARDQGQHIEGVFVAESYNAWEDICEAVLAHVADGGLDP